MVELSEGIAVNKENKLIYSIKTISRLEEYIKLGELSNV